MNSKNLNTKLKEIEKDINEIENIDGIKKLVNKYNAIQNKIEESKNILRYITESMLNIDNKTYNEEFTNEKYILGVDELENIKGKINDNHEQMELEELITLYNRANILILNCTNFLSKQKMEVINIE